MATFAIIDSGVVVNTIVADGWGGGIDITELSPRPGIGWLYDGQAFAPPPPRTTTRMTHLGFLKRMSAEEWGRLDGLLASSVEARFAKAQFDMARDVDVSLPEVQTFAYTLRAVGVLLEDQRVADLLSPLPIDSEHALP